MHFDRARFDACHQDEAPGDLHGITFPFTPAGLREAGASFLTDAFHAAGSLDRADAVASIDAIEPCTGGQASDKVFLDLSFASGATARLFAKMPAADPERKFFLANAAAFEVDFARISARAELPFAVPRYWFGDYASATSNFLLITDCVPYGEDGVAPECEKGMDHLLPDARERYLVLAEALGGLAAAHGIGALGDVEAMFPFPANAPRARPARDPEAKLDRIVDFVGRRASHLFPEAMSAPPLLDAFRSDVLYAIEHLEDLAASLHADRDRVGLCHPNLNLDNAWFWREDGMLRAGLLDWGMTRQMNFGQAISGMLMFPEPEGYPALVRDVIETFARTCAEAGGPKLDPVRIRADLQVSLFMSTIPMLLDIVVEQFDRFSDADYAAMASRFDPRLLESGLGAGVVWLSCVLEEWRHDATPGDACRAALGVA